MAKQSTRDYINNEDFFNALVEYKEKCESSPTKPKIPEYIGECFLKIAENLAKRPNFYGYCVDNQTEALTQRGWLKQDEITTEDYIASVDPKDFTLKWSRILSIYKNESYDDKCHRIEGVIDALITPGHKWLTLRGLVKFEELQEDDKIVVNVLKDNIDVIPLNQLKVSSVKYSGTVWCPETEYGSFVCRRNGRIYVTGNSFKDEMILDGIENMILYSHNFDPNKSKNPFAYFTQITWFAFVRRIAKEKKQQYIKYKATESFGVLDEAELMELGNGEIKQIEIYDNLYEFISAYEEADITKKQQISKSKGIELFIEDLEETLKEEELHE